MELLVNRKTRTELSVIGDFFLNDKRIAFTLEDTDRGLTSEMPITEIVHRKIHGQTAIPTGRYQVVKYFSPKHQANIPLLVNVPGFVGVEIHVGNVPADTDGCLLIGYGIGEEPDTITDSKKAVDAFYQLFFKAIKAGEDVYITYKTEY